MTQISVGVDVGGTFTDFVVLDPQRGRLQLKRPTSRPDPSVGILEGLSELGVGACILSHGTTAATNVALERRGPRTALVTTRGFGDVLQLGRGQRLDLYALLPPARPSLVPPELCFEVNQRMDARGNILEPLQTSECERLAQSLRNLKVEAVAVCLLFAYLNPAHELQLAECLERHGLNVSLSHRVDPQPKEYERASTTVLQAYVAPSLDRYLNHLNDRLAQADLWVVRSSGSVCRPREAVDKAVGCLLSGPAAGLQGAWKLAQELEIGKLMTLDVGGTSTDVALCDGQLPYLEESSVAGLPFRCPQADIQTVGAGGGSIASLDAGGLLQVGPQSAGSQPGPACYGQGGPATVTDALLLLGRLPNQLAGGRMGLDSRASQAAVEKLARALNLPLLETAAAILALAEHNMAQALRLISLERGYDPRRFVLTAFGGGGASHATALAEQLGIKRVLVPAQPGLLCAQGAILAPWQAEEQRAWLAPWLEVQDQLADWSARARANLKSRAPEGKLQWRQQWEIRYRGQGSSLWLKAGARLEQRFHALHLRRFGYQRPNQSLELVSSLLRAYLERPQPRIDIPPCTGKRAGHAQAHVGLPPEPVTITIYEGYPDFWVTGPARLQTMDGTVWIGANWRAKQAAKGSLIMESLVYEEEHAE
ncbi:hydantoinase/oxoprolinase family protein [bacterium]|nr:hydantoinase/oxoprolinase family protein [bacterium]